jgi:UDP-N-acetylenolpyruvoylglucosamine reductase
MPGDPGATVVTNARAYYHTTRGCGCNGHPAFPTPSLGGSFMHNSGASRGEIAEMYLELAI